MPQVIGRCPLLRTVPRNSVSSTANRSSVRMALPFTVMSRSSSSVLLATECSWGGIRYGGETNYIMATVTLFVSVFNLFNSLLHLLGFAQGE